MKLAPGVLFGLLLLGFLAYLGSLSEVRQVAELPPLRLPARMLPEERSFLMGFTYQPYDWSEEAFADTFDFVAGNGDFIVHYLDEGAPWVEAFEGKPYPANVEEDLARRLDNIRPGQKVVLAANALGLDRETLAGNWGAETSIDPAESHRRPGVWNDKRIDDPDVIAAFANFCETLIERFEPSYFFYSAEVNWAFTDPSSPQFQRFLAFSEGVYTRLKARYPTLPVSLEFVVAHERFMRQRAATTRALLAYSDVFGVSTYPYVAEASPDVLGDATKIPENWFSLVQELFPGKPIAVLETGFNAKSISYWDRNIPGNESSQDLYLRFLLDEANRMNFEFVNWWVYRDYDLLWEKMAAGGVDSAFDQWRATGLLDGAGEARPVLDTWKAWQRLPIRQ